MSSSVSISAEDAPADVSKRRCAMAGTTWMRIAGGLTLACIALAARAWPPELMRYSPEAAKAAGVQPSAELVRHFPDKARAAGIQGSAELSCGQTVHLGLRDCVLLSESPEGYDFGGAALSLSQASRQKPH